MDTWEAEKTNFTEHVWDQFDFAVQKPDFLEKDADYIYGALLEDMHFISFGEYLKRFLYRKTGMTEPFETVPLSEYQATIRSCFSDLSVPPSFQPTTAKLSMLAKHWLTQQTVKRNVVFLLGFGLNMSVDEVNTALTKWLRERKINPRNALEVICWYCYTHSYRYPKFEELYHRYLAAEPNLEAPKPVWSENTHVIWNSVAAIRDDDSLIAYVASLKEKDPDVRYGQTAQMRFNCLYEEAKEKITALYNEYAADQNDSDVRELREQLENNPRLTNEEKLQKIKEMQSRRRVWTAEEITESDFEEVICASIPKDRNGNLSPAKRSSLNAQFSGYRFSRQHIGEVRKGNTEITRFDLLTMQFFLASQRLDEYPDAKTRFYRFVEDCDNLLNDCSMGELYIQNPYECFLMMCILSDDPLCTYADVMERAYQEA